VSAQPLTEIIAKLGYKQLDREVKPAWTLARSEQNGWISN
jgi:hypothetical protein